MSAFSKFCSIVEEINTLANKLIQTHKDSIIETNGTTSQIVSKKEEVIKLRDQLYSLVENAKTSDSILDKLIMECIINLENKDVKATNFSWYSYVVNTNYDNVLNTLPYLVKYLVDIKNGSNNFLPIQKLIDYGIPSQYQKLLTYLIYVKSRYYNDGSENYTKIQTKVETLSEHVESYHNMTTSIQNKEAVINDRIDYLRKDYMMLYHEMTSLKETVSTLRDNLDVERYENANLRKQLQQYKEEHADAFTNLRKELLINNGNLVYISNIKFSPEYDYESIKAHNCKLHKEFKRIYRIFARNMLTSD